MEGDFFSLLPHLRRRHFNPLPPHGGRLTVNSPWRLASHISIHSLRMEGDISLFFSISGSNYFNPLPPHGGRRLGTKTYIRSVGISIHSLRMEGDVQITINFQFLNISIHSLRMEGDLSGYRRKISEFHFNPLPPHGGRLPEIQCDITLDAEFQSTPSAWRETFDLSVLTHKHCISIHSLRMEGDMRRCRRFLLGFHFNPLPPHGGRRNAV